MTLKHEKIKQMLHLLWYVIKNCDYTPMIENCIKNLHLKNEKLIY